MVVVHGDRVKHPSAHLTRFVFLLRQHKLTPSVAKRSIRLSGLVWVL